MAIAVMAIAQRWSLQRAHDIMHHRVNHRRTVTLAGAVADMSDQLHERQWEPIGIRWGLADGGFYDVSRSQGHLELSAFLVQEPQVIDEPEEEEESAPARPVVPPMPGVVTPPPLRPPQRGR